MIDNIADKPVIIMQIGNEISRSTLTIVPLANDLDVVTVENLLLDSAAGAWQICPLHPTMFTPHRFHGSSDCKDVSAFLFASREPISCTNRVVAASRSWSLPAAWNCP